jgi:hypothetical protein
MPFATCNQNASCGNVRVQFVYRGWPIICRQARQQIIMLAAIHYPDPNQVAKCEQQASSKVTRSNVWRRAALVCFWLALVCFIVGCYFGTRAILPD